jgi:hypothetical protein
MAEVSRDDVDRIEDHDNKMTREEFGRLFISRLKKAGVTCGIDFSQEDFVVRPVQSDRSTGTFQVVRLENTYRDYQNARPEEKEGVLSQLVRVSLLPDNVVPGDFQDAAHDLLPAIRSRSRHEISLLRSLIEDGCLPPQTFHPFAVHLAMTLTYSLPDAVVHVGEEELAKWDVSMQEAMRAAMKQLAALPHPFKSVEGHRGIFESAADDGYDSSRILLPPLAAALPVRGTHVAMLPHPAHFYVAGEDDPVALEIMVRQAEWVLAQPRPITGYAFRLEDGDWRPWLPAPSHALYQRFRTLQLRSAYDAYMAQGELLHILEKRKAEDDQCFVATFMVGSTRPGGPLHSATAWSEGIATLLPTVDEICFVRGSVKAGFRMMGTAPWRRVVDILGDRMEPLGLYPERYRVRTFPSDNELTLLAGA